LAGGAAVGMRHKKFFAGEPNVKTVMKGGDMPVPLSVVPPSMGDAPAPSTYYYRSVDVNSLVISCKHGCALSNLHLLLLSSCLDRQAHHLLTQKVHSAPITQQAGKLASHAQRANDVPVNFS
jgi:hypothetical protein